MPTTIVDPCSWDLWAMRTITVVMTISIMEKITFVVYLPVPGVDAALVLHDLAPLTGLLEPHGQHLLHPVLVLVGVRQEHVVRLLLRRGRML